MNKIANDSVFLSAAGAAAMQCFSHFRQKHLQKRNTAPDGPTIKSAVYEAAYSPDLSNADRHLTLNIRLASPLGDRSTFSFMAPAKIGNVKSVAARANGRPVPTVLRRHGDRTEILAKVGDQAKNKALKLELSFNTPSMVLSRDGKSAFLADFLVADAAIEQLNTRVQLPGGWKFDRSLPNGVVKKKALNVRANHLRPCEHQLMCFGTTRA